MYAEDEEEDDDAYVSDFVNNYIRRFPSEDPDAGSEAAC
jgi:hypothetical protein